MDVQEMMEKYEKLGKPGEQHKLLERLTGSWEAKVKNWLEAGATPMESMGTSGKKMIMGGRFLQELFNGIMMGNKFSGLSITGYDNHSEKFETVWLDSTSTSLLLFQGTVSQDQKKITMDCSHADVVRGPMNWRSVTTFIDDNTHLFEMFSMRQNGKAERIMEITYTRKK